MTGKGLKTIVLKDECQSSVLLRHIADFCKGHVFHFKYMQIAELAKAPHISSHPSNNCHKTLLIVNFV